VPIEDVLESLARSVTDLFGLARCEIETELVERPIVVRGRGSGTEADAESIPLTVGDRDLGRIVAVPDVAHAPLGAEERGVIQTLAAQIAVSPSSPP
jgi:hypothetical protein